MHADLRLIALVVTTNANIDLLPGLRDPSASSGADAEWGRGPPDECRLRPVGSMCEGRDCTSAERALDELLVHVTESVRAMAGHGFDRGQDQAALDSTLATMASPCV